MRVGFSPRARGCRPLTFLEHKRQDPLECAGGRHELTVAVGLRVGGGDLRGAASGSRYSPPFGWLVFSVAHTRKWDHSFGIDGAGPEPVAVVPGRGASSQRPIAGRTFHPRPLTLGGASKTCAGVTCRAAELVVARERSTLRPDICQQPTYLITVSNNPCSRRWTIYAKSGKSTVASNTAGTGKTERRRPCIRRRRAPRRARACIYRCIMLVYWHATHRSFLRV